MSIYGDSEGGGMAAELAGVSLGRACCDAPHGRGCGGSALHIYASFWAVLAASSRVDCAAGHQVGRGHQLRPGQHVRRHQVSRVTGTGRVRWRIPLSALGAPSRRKKVGGGIAAVLGIGLVYYLYSSSFFANEGQQVGRFVTSSQAVSWDDARDFCESKYEGLASIHSPQEQADAVAACKAVDGGLSKVWDGSDTGTSSENKRPVGCWIGLADVGGEGSFTW